MDSTFRRLLLSCGVLALAICLCLSAVSIGGAGLFVWNQTISTNPTAQITTPSPEPQTTEQPSSGSIPPAIAVQLDEIQNQVSDLRGLTPQRPVDRGFLTSAELRQRVEQDFLSEYSPVDARDDTITLAAFGLLEPDFDLHGFYLELYSEQIAGFYDDELAEMYVVQDGDFTGTERLTYAHEFVHALQDQNFDFDDGLFYTDEACKSEVERCAALQALIEGDATLLEIQWLSLHGTSQDFSDIQEFYGVYQSPVYDNAPSFLQEDFLFPYAHGQNFVDELHRQGGWPAVDAVYANAPITTEQILHPERYPDEGPLPVELPDLDSVLGSGWREIDRNIMGEWYTYLILAHGRSVPARLNQRMAETASDGWGGDAYAVYYNETSEGIAAVLQTVWDSTADANQFAQAFRNYAAERFGEPEVQNQTLTSWESPEGYVAFHQENATTTWMLTPDQATAQALWDTIEASSN